MAANPISGADGSLDAAAESFVSLLEPDEVQEAPQETTEEVSEEVTETESDDEEVIQEETEEESEEADASEEEVEETQQEKFERLTELAEALEMSPEEFEASIKTSVKVNGEEIDVSLAELRKGFQMESDYRQKTAALAEQRKAFEEQTQAKLQEISQNVEQSTSIVDMIEQQLVNEYEGVDWNALRAQSPADYAAARQDYADRLQQVQGMREQVREASEYAQKEMLTKQFETQQQILQEESARLLEAIPEWSEPEQAKAGKSEIASYLKEYGFGDQELNNLIDHRSVVIARKAMLYDRMNKTAKVAEKKVSKLPKIMKPGAKQGKEDTKSFKRSEQMKRLKKSHRVEDAASLFKEFLE